MSMRQQVDGAALSALGVLALVWGYNWVAVKMALEYTGPFTFAAARSLGGGLVLLLIVLACGRLRWPRRPGFTLLLGLLQTALFTSFTCWALVQGGAGKSAVLVFTMPFWVILLAPLVLGEKLRGAQWLPVALALGGLTLIFSPWRHAPDSLSGLFAIAAGVCWALAVLVAKRMPTPDRWELLSLTGWQMLLGALPLLLLAWWVPGRATDWTPVYLATLGYNVLFANAMAWFLWLFIVNRLPATLSGLTSLVIPVVGVLSGWLQLGERPAPTEAAGMVLVLASIALLSFLPRPSPN